MQTASIITTTSTAVTADAAPNVRPLPDMSSLPLRS
jgi:hypothetical protein